MFTMQDDDANYVSASSSQTCSLRRSNKTWSLSSCYYWLLLLLNVATIIIRCHRYHHVEADR